MSDTGEKSQKEKENLARIRDNQRRSRARRKEYLSELEAKWRNCEQTRVEATAEVQAAARQVLDENKRLRALLRFKGVGDTEIDAFELNSMSSATRPDDLLPSSTMLEAMLNDRRTGCSSCSSSTAPKPSPSPVLGPQSSSLLHLPPSRRSTGGWHAVDDPAPSQQHTPWTGDLTIFDQRSSSQSPIMQRHASPAFTANYEQMPAWDQEYAPSAMPASSSNTCSCAEVAEMMRTMGSEVDESLRQQLGCGNNNLQCQTNTNLVFDMLDKYQSGDV